MTKMFSGFYPKFLAVATFGVVAVLLAVGLDSWFSRGKAVKTLAASAAVSSAASQVETARVQELEKRIDVLENQVENLIHSDPKLTLARVSRCIDSMDKDIPASCGSFSDFIVPELYDASKAGASKREISILLDRVYSMAQEKKYY